MEIFSNLTVQNHMMIVKNFERFRKFRTSVDWVECKLFKSLSSMQDYISREIDGLTKEFYEYFWNVTKNPIDEFY